MEFFQLFLLGLAAQRILYLWFASELLRIPRELISRLGQWPAYLVNCSICMSVWVGAFVVGADTLGKVGQFLLWILAVGALAGPLHGLIMVLENLQYHLSQRASAAVATPEISRGRVEALEAEVASLRSVVKG
jgi:hypothetical protein